MSDTRKTSAAARAFTAAMQSLFDAYRLSERQAARMLMVSPVFVHRARRGLRMFTPAHVEILCGALRVSDETRAILHRMGARAGGWDIPSPCTLPAGGAGDATQEEHR